jgi:tetratricopeptide (TPR) repeat protein
MNERKEWSRRMKKLKKGKGVRPRKAVKSGSFEQTAGQKRDPEKLTEARRHLDRAYVYEENAELEQALAECEAAITLAPSLAEVHNLLGIVWEGLGYPQEALQAYKQAVKLAPQFHDAAKNLSELRAELEKKSGLVTIAKFSHPTEAHIAKTKLQASGVWSFIADECIVTMNWLFSNTVGGVKLLVKATDVDIALEILGQEPYNPKLKKSGPQCPACESFDVHYEKYALRRVFAAFLLLRMPFPFPKKKWVCRDCGHEWKAET